MAGSDSNKEVVLAASNSNEVVDEKAPSRLVSSKKQRLSDLFTIV